MLVEKLKACFCGRSAEEQAEFLARLSHNLTIGGRDAYVRVGRVRSQEQALQELEGFNELQHSISAQQGALLEQIDERYPDDVFCNILAEKAEHYGVGKALEWSVGTAELVQR